MPVIAACPGNGPTVCTRAVEAALKSATGSAAQRDAGTLVTLSWPSPTSAMPAGYFQRGEARANASAELNSFAVTSASSAEADLSPRDGGFSFTVIFPEPDRLAVGDGCEGTHGGMDDTIELEVEVSAQRAVSTSASVSFGSY